MAAADLFGWQELKAAEAAVAEAHAAQDAARRMYRYAPHGMRRERERAYIDATTAALRAEAALSALHAETDL